MITMTFHQKVIGAIGIASLILIVVGGFSYRRMIQENADQQLVAHTHLVMESLAEIQTDLSDAGVSQRVYLISGDKADLEPYLSALEQLREDLRTSDELTSGDATQRDLLRRLEIAAETRIGELQARIDLKKAQRPLPAQPVSARSQSMAQVRSLVGEMTDNEQHALAQETKAAEVSARRMKAVLIIGNLLAFLLFLSAGLVIYQEMSKRTSAEESLRNSEEKLRAANKELESFSYSVSHDLRAPLRSIDGFSKALLDDYGDQLNTEAKDYLNRVRMAAQRMGNLIDGLLNLSRMTRAELRKQMIDLSKLAHEIEVELREGEPGREVDFQVALGLQAQGDLSLVRVVLENLLRNSWKFTSKRERGSIEVGRTQNNGSSAYFVRDNGAGFNPSHSDRLFGAFQRLHSADEFPGTGIGLATVQRIIRRHGGQIWAEAGINQGATFYFTL